MFKTVAVCVGIAFAAFGVMQLHQSGQLNFLDIFGGSRAATSSEPPGAKFPEALAPAVRGEPVAEAAAFTKSATDPHATVILDRSGRLHDWHVKLNPDWRAETVETTELILVVGTQKKTLIQLITYPNGAPPVSRYRYDMDAWLIEAKTGKEIERKRFVSVARPIRPVEVWDLTELGDPVDCATVSQWLRDQAASYAVRLYNDQ